MKQSDAKELFALLGMPASYCAFGDNGIGENWSLLQQDHRWIVRYIERGEVISENFFDFESEAVSQLVAQVMRSDPRISQRIEKLQAMVAARSK